MSKMTRHEEIARQEFIAGQTDAINSIPPQSEKYYYKMGLEDATYEMSLGLINCYFNKDTQKLEPTQI
ncbi:hypothetical protein PCC7424_2493 [Gloeothece citriformis PCC 7424]|uniref:Uncharacterized protein n=1 Tax=Gloeothece citriformis (strain PCC 7424) TaxID=65393 RepID=B7KK25_GLOC7|nr:hypothetical protein [Gloeothece citriformis]ACK70910.1 hypothetical protein PCC7424_2493 [Gloeothece citriformis PCC 7424]